MFKWFWKRQEEQEPEEPQVQIEYCNICEDFIEGEQLVSTEDDVFVNSINILKKEK